MSEKAANYVAKGMSAQARMYKILGWSLIIIGVPLILLFGLGFLVMGCGAVFLWLAKKIQKSASTENIKEHLEGIGAVVDSIRSRAEERT